MSTLVCHYRSMSGKKASATSTREAPYHRENLRETLIQAGLALIAEQGIRALTLREIGARVGVSRMAPYRHFKDKDDLIAAICEAGFSQFADALEKARKKAKGNFRERLRAMARAYVRFAAENPAYYETMFGGPQAASRESVEGARAFQVLNETIREGQQTGEVRDGNSVTFAQLVWAQVHGIATLHLSARDGGAEFIDVCVDVLADGLTR